MERVCVILSFDLSIGGINGGQEARDGREGSTRWGIWT